MNAPLAAPVHTTVARPGADCDRYLICFDAERDPVLFSSLEAAAKHVRGFDRHDFRNLESVIAFNSVEGWSRDVTEDVARLVYSGLPQDDNGRAYGASYDLANFLDCCLSLSSAEMHALSMERQS